MEIRLVRQHTADVPELAQTFGIGASPGAVRLAAGIIQLYTIAGQPITPETQQAGHPGGTVGKRESRSEITIPDEWVQGHIGLFAVLPRSADAVFEAQHVFADTMDELGLQSGITALSTPVNVNAE